MKFSQFDRYARYFTGAALLIALLTYWRFRGLDLSAAYAYVAQGDVIRSILFRNMLPTRSIVWDFFGLIDRVVTPHSVSLLRVVGLVLMLLDLFLLSRLVDYILGQKFWGFLAVFLVALSPFAVSAAVSGGPEAVAVALTLLFLMALYRNEYVYAGLLAGICSAANLPGLIMFLIALLDLLQNFHDRKKMVSRLLITAASFFGALSLVYLYSMSTGNAVPFSITVGGQLPAWSFTAVLALFVANAINLAGIAYLIVKRRYDVYRTHFHTIMLWITGVALCIAQPTTLNLLVALVVSMVLSVFFLQGFSALWKPGFVSADTLVFLFIVLFLFGDMYANNKFLRDELLEDSYQKNEAVNDVVAAVARSGNGAKLVSNFVPAELSVKLGRQIYEADQELLPVAGFEEAAASTIYVARRESKVETISTGCAVLLSTSFYEEGKTYFVEVVKCGKQNE
jgi:hypothetical protein